MKYIDTWDLDSIFPGGTKSPELQTKLHNLKEEIQQYEKIIQEWNVTEDQSIPSVKRNFKKEENIENGLGQSRTFVQMWHDAYMNDEYANVVMGQMIDLSSEVENLSTIFTKKLVSIPDEDWKNLFEDPELKEVSFALNEIRDQGKRLLSEEEEKIITDLNKDGISGMESII